MTLTSRASSDVSDEQVLCLWQPIENFTLSNITVTMHKGVRAGFGRIRFAPLPIRFISDQLREPVPLFLKRQCDRTLGASRVRVHGLERDEDRDGAVRDGAAEQCGAAAARTRVRLPRAALR
jgi:hypothetical protein